MKDSSFGFIICISVSILVVAILLQRPTKESFELNSSPLVFDQSSVGIGIAIGLVFLLVLFGIFFLFFYSIPKGPNAFAPRNSFFLNNQY